MTSDFDPWDENNPYISSMMQNKTDNIRIITDETVSNNLCVIFFSSNGIYFPNTFEVFKEKIIDGDRFDYLNISKEIVASKKIFLRDLHKQWYVTGVNLFYSSIDLLFEFLKNETEGYDVITIGSSAGGYAATLLGTKLGAKILCYSGQFDINKYKGGISEKYNSLLYQYRNSRGKYYDLYNLISESNVKIYYFFPSRSNDDIVQYYHVEHLKNIIPIKFCYKEHSRTHPPVFLPYILSNIDKLDKFTECKKELTGFKFAVKLMGLKLALKYSIKRILIKINRWLYGGESGVK